MINEYTATAAIKNLPTRSSGEPEVVSCAIVLDVCTAEEFKPAMEVADAAETVAEAGDDVANTADVAASVTGHTVVYCEIRLVVVEP